MAACLRCGKAKLRRNKRGERKCQRCGVMPSAKHLDRGGNFTLDRSRQLIADGIEVAILDAIDGGDRLGELIGVNEQ